jgi:hypothetical protein
VETSEQINEIATALARAQAEIKGAKKDSDNPFFKSTYADLASVREACVPQLTSHGIAVVQSPATREDGSVAVTTTLLHTSGQWMRGTVSAKPKDDGAQALGSVITYLRRYSLAAFAGVAPEDDDGNAAEGKGTSSGTVMRVDAPKVDKNGPLTIASVVKKETKRKNFFRWEVTLSNGKKASFVNNDRMAAVCEQLAQSGGEVDVVIESGDYGPELREVVAVKQVEAPAPQPLTGEQTRPF